VEVQIVSAAPGIAGAGSVRGEPDVKDVRSLQRLVTSSSWFMDVLSAVRDSGLPDALVGAGALRDLVWGELHGSFVPGDVKDVDVAYFDPSDLGPERDVRAEEALRRLLPGVPWEAKNQAAVHTWYARRFGGVPYAPVRSACEAVSRWPETATSVAVRLDAGGRLRVCAPVGLADLLDGVWRRNPRQVSLEESVRRLRKHRVAERWPRVRVIHPGAQSDGA
jgi:hypothetical protein